MGVVGRVYADVVLGDGTRVRVPAGVGGGGFYAGSVPLDLDYAITPGGRVGDASPLGHKGGPRQLDDYVREVAHALMRKRGFTKSHAIATAKNALKRWRRGGGKVRPQVRAGAAAHLALQEGLDKSRGKGHNLAHPVAHELLDLAWSDALHPRGPGGKFKSRGAARNKTRTKAKLPKDKRPDQRLARAARLAQEEQARRIIARGGLHRGQLHKPHGAHKVYSGEGRFRPSGALTQFAVELAAERNIDLGVNGARWKHGWIPLNAEAVKIAKARKKAGLGKGGALPGADLHRAAKVEKATRQIRNVKAHNATTRKKVVDAASAEAHYRKHVEHVDTSIENNQHLSTDKVHGTVNEHGETVYNAERAKLHNQIVNEVFAHQAKTAKRERKALFLGGLPGAGKTTALTRTPGLKQSDYITVNPDIFKEELAKRGLVPKLKGLTPLEASAFAHNESSHLATMLATKARRHNYNIIHDITINSVKSVDDRKKPLDEAGYKSSALFVDIPHEMSQQRVRERHRRGYEAFLADRTGKHLGQRLVPSSHVMTGKSKLGSTSANRDAFEQAKHGFDNYTIIDNSGDTPKIVEKGGTATLKAGGKKESAVKKLSIAEAANTARSTDLQRRFPLGTEITTKDGLPGVVVEHNTGTGNMRVKFEGVDRPVITQPGEIKVPRRRAKGGLT